MLLEDRNKAKLEFVDWYRRAAEQGYARSAARLAELIHSGAVKSIAGQDYIFWLRRASDLGDDRSMVLLSMAYRDGDGIGRDAKKAAMLLERAADLGNIGANLRLGMELSYSRSEHGTDGRTADFFLNRAKQLQLTKSDSENEID